MKTMKRGKFFWIVASLLAGLVVGCSFSVGGGGEELTRVLDLAATRAALEATKAALANPPLETPAELPVEATAELPVEATASSPYYTEEFSSEPDTWSYFLLKGKEGDLEIYSQNDRLVFDISGENVWAYYTYQSYPYTDVRVDAHVTNLGFNTTFSLICRYTDFGWYEFNVGSNGLYNILRYEYKTDFFRELYSGGLQNLNTGKASNDFAIICKGNRLTFIVNGVEIRKVEDSAFEKGLVGVSVSSFDTVPVFVEFDYVMISQP